MADDAQIEQVLASMPLRIWRTDEVTPLTPAPERPRASGGMAGNVAIITGSLDGHLPGLWLRVRSRRTRQLGQACFG
jgi:hypothetical protein